MVGSTLPSWTTILLSGSIFLIVFGYINHYVPKDQKEKAKALKESSSYFSEDRCIKYGTRVNPLCYCIIAALISMVTIIVFFVTGDSVLVNGIIESLGLFGYIINVLAAIIVFFLLSLFLIILACVGETVAVNEDRDHYWRVYGVFMESGDK